MTRSTLEPLPLYRPGERRALQPRRFVIGCLLARGDALLLIGAPQSGKSAVAVEAAVAVAAGAPFFGQRTCRGVVIYIAMERYGETDIRLELSMRDHGDVPVRLAQARIGEDPDDVAELIAAMLQFAADAGADPALVVFDTVNALLRNSSGEENSARDIGRLTLAIDRVRAATGAAVILVHHSKRGEDRSRGSEALEAWADTVAMVAGRKDQLHIKVVRSNTIDEGIKATFTLVPIDLGEDADTGSRSAAVLAKSTTKLAARADPVRLAPDVQAALTALKTLPDPAAVSEWRAATMPAYDGRAPGARRQAFLTAKSKLMLEGLILIEGESVSVSKASAMRQRCVSTDVPDAPVSASASHP